MKRIKCKCNDPRCNQQLIIDVDTISLTHQDMAFIYDTDTLIEIIKEFKTRLKNKIGEVLS